MQRAGKNPETIVRQAGRKAVEYIAVRLVPDLRVEAVPCVSLHFSP